MISQDDKSRVPIRQTAANKQAPMLMHLDYRVKLSGYDWMIASQHKLITSVYAGINIKDKTIGDQKQFQTQDLHICIAIRSGKHSSSSAETHAFDFQRLVNLESFKDTFYDKKFSIVKTFLSKKKM